MNNIEEKHLEKHLEEYLRQLFIKYNIKNITNDSRNVNLNNLAFFAIKGNKFNGNDYINELIYNKHSDCNSDAGNINLIFTDDKNIKDQYQGQAQAKDQNKINIILINNSTLGYAIAAKILYPNICKNIFAVTGTNGKTSIVNYATQILKIFNINAVSMGTIGININNDEVSNNINKLLIKDDLTTSDILTLRKNLSILHKNNIDVAAIEVSSHAIEQMRVKGVCFNNIGFVSFSQDHLDYHLSMENYFNSKLKLFSHEYLVDSELESDKSYVVVNYNLNSDDKKYGLKLINHLIENQISFILIAKLDNAKERDEILSLIDHRLCYLILEIGNIETINFHQKAEILIHYHNFTKEDKIYIETDIIGSFQITNLLIAAMMSYKAIYNSNIANKETKSVDQFIDIDLVKKLLKQLSHINATKGRMELIKLDDKILNKYNSKGQDKEDIKIFIDYAHTPDALEKSLIELRQSMKQGQKLSVLFGCGGDRDKQKRGMMGSVAAKIADIIIVTDDNPRNENPNNIRREIIESIEAYQNKYKNQKTQYFDIGNREEAIKFAINNLNFEKGDILLIAGKGHEEYQIIKNEKIKFSDKEVVYNVLD